MLQFGSNDPTLPTIRRIDAQLRGSLNFNKTPLLEEEEKQTLLIVAPLCSLHFQMCGPVFVRRTR